MDQNRGVVIYITPEIAIDPRIQSYSGGLGYLAGSAAMSAEKVGLPMAVFSMIHRKGYCTQKCGPNGMYVDDVACDHLQYLEKTGVEFTINVCNKPIWVELFRLPSNDWNSVSVNFMTTDVEKNDYLSRLICDQLYGENPDRRPDRKIAQSIILGGGTIEACKRLNIPSHCFHINESHGVLTQIYLAQQYGVEWVRANTVFTTHTPVESGNPSYSIDDLSRMNGFNPEFLKQLGGDPLNMAMAGIKLARKSNAVSRKHFEVCRKLWHWVFTSGNIGSFDDKFTYVTNGVNVDYWQYPEFKKAERVEEIKKAKKIYKRKMIDYIRQQPHVGKYLSENIFTVVWARRFAGYKRPKLMFDYLSGWLFEHLRNNRMQLIFAGKPHPDDKRMIDEWNYIFKKSQNWPNLVILPGYDLELSKILKGGADLWLNTPRSHWEASGTSGMSANLNGALHMSTPDGWAHEADQDSYFPFGSPVPMRDYEQDRFDAESLRTIMDELAIPMFYNDSPAWYGKAILAKLQAETRFSSDRMVVEYAEKMYGLLI